MNYIIIDRLTDRKVKLLTDYIVKMRKAKGLSQNDLASMSGISRQGLRKIESCQSVPSLHTLAKLTVALSVDLLSFFQRLEDEQFLVDLYKAKIHAALIDHNFESVKTLEYEVGELLKEIGYSLYKKELKQLHMFLQANIIEIKSKEYNQSIDLISKAISITSPKFELKNFKKVQLFGQENKLANNLVLVLNNVSEVDLAISLSEHLIESAATVDSDIECLLYNLVCIYVAESKFDNARILLDRSYAVTTDIDSLIYLKYIDARIRYKRGDETYINYLNSAIDLCDNKKYYNLKSLIENNSIKHMEVGIDDEKNLYVL